MSKKTNRDKSNLSTAAFCIKGGWDKFRTKDNIF